jgi:hypothetical protein
MPSCITWRRSQKTILSKSHHKGGAHPCLHLTGKQHLKGDFEGYGGRCPKRETGPGCVCGFFKVFFSATGIFLPPRCVA